jgi:hypothetical protein
MLIPNMDTTILHVSSLLHSALVLHIIFANLNVRDDVLLVKTSLILVKQYHNFITY